MMKRFFGYVENKKIYVFLCLAFFVTAAVWLPALTGCGRTAQTQDSPAASAEAEAEAELEVWIFFDENTPGTYYVDLWDDLAGQLGCSVDVRTYSTEQIKDKLRIALACDDLPDIFAVWGGNYPDFLFEAGACAPVEDYLASAAFSFQESYVQPYEDGHNYIIPCLVEAYAVTYCNQELMQKIGLTEPQTWDDLIRLTEQVNAYNEANGTDYAAIELGDKDGWLGELLYTMIVNRIDPDAQDKLADGSVDFSDSCFADAADKLVQLADLGAFPDNYMEKGEVEAVADFASGKSVLFPHQSTIVYHLLDEMGEDALSVLQFPSCNADFDDTYSSYLMDINHTLTPGLCVSADTAEPELAAKLCLLFAESVNRQNVSEYDYLDIISDSGIAAPEESSLAVRQFHEMIDGAQKTTPLWYAVMDKENGDNWRNLTKKLLGRAVTVDEFLQTAPGYLYFHDNTEQ